MIRGNRFLLSTFDGSLKCATKTWVMKLEAFFLLHPIVEKEAVEISALHFEGKARYWWSRNVSHARVSTFPDFTHQVIRRFDSRRPEEEEFSSPLEETFTSVVIFMRGKSSIAAVGSANTFKGGTLAVIQDVPKAHKGMHKFPCPNIS